MCGRTTVFQDSSRSGRRGLDAIDRYREADSLSAVILMLGTNDCKTVFRASPEQIGCGLEQCLIRFEQLIPPEKILVVSPLLLGKDVWKPEKDPAFDKDVWKPEKDPAFDKQSVRTCAALKDIYRKIAERRGCAFLAASDHAEACHVDEEHLNAEGHEHLAAAILSGLKTSGIM